MLGDALLRTRDAGEAVGILDEGIAAFPEDQGLQRRLALAHAMAGHEELALTLLTAWVDAHPEDTPALFATLALLFDGFSREAAGGAKAEEQQRLRRYGKAYLDSQRAEPPDRGAVAALSRLARRGLTPGRATAASAAEPAPEPAAQASRLLVVVGPHLLLALQPVEAGRAQRPLQADPARLCERPPAGGALDRPGLISIAQGMCGVADGI